MAFGQALVSNNHDRAAPKGLGAVKAAGNYAADIAPVHSAHAEGYNTTLYLDAKERKFIEEFSVCNFVGITKAGLGARVDYLIWSCIILYIIMIYFVEFAFLCKACLLMYARVLDVHVK